MGRQALNILFITLGYPPDVTGGAERQARQQAEALVRRGQKVVVVCPRHPGQGSGSVAEGVVVRRLGCPTLPLARVSYVFALLAFVVSNARRFDVMHAHALRLPSNLAGLLLLMMRRRVYMKIATSGDRGEVAYWTQGWRRWLSVLPHVARVQALTTDLADELAKAGVPRARVVCIPNGIDLTRFRPADAGEKAQARRELGLPADGLIVLYCGTFQPLKGTPELLSAWQRVASEAATVVLVGEAAGAYRLPSVQGVTVRPWQQDVAAYYRAADVFVLPSRAEGMSNALLEALASGLAVVATRVGAAESLMRDGEHGLLVAPDDVDGLAMALRRVLEDEALRARLGSVAPEAVQALGIDAVVGQIEAVYREMVGH